MRAPQHPSRTILLLTVAIVIGLGVAGYLVNFPLRYILVGEAIAFVAILWRASQSKQTQPLQQSGHDSTIVR